MVRTDGYIRIINHLYECIDGKFVNGDYICVEWKNIKEYFDSEPRWKLKGSAVVIEDVDDSHMFIIEALKYGDRKNKWRFWDKREILSAVLKYMRIEHEDLMRGCNSCSCGGEGCCGE